MRRLTMALALAVTAAGAARAQTDDLARRVASAAGASVAFEFPARAGVCGDGRSFIRVGANSFMGNWNGRQRDTTACVAGPVRVVVRKSDGAVASLRYAVGPVPDDGATELGLVTAAAGAGFLLDLAARESDRTASDAIPAALLGEGVNAAPRLLAIARARPASRRGDRHEPLFWAGRYAAARLRGADTPFADDGCPDDDKREAVFALSQMRGDDAVPALIDVVRRNADACVRGSALFWLVESGDARALDVVASILGEK